MVNSEYAIAYSEVLEILKYIPIEDYNKIPKDKIELFKAKADINYTFKYNPNQTLTEQNISKIAKGIIAILFRDYWATDTQKEKIISKQKYDRRQVEEEKRKNYNPENIFTNNSNIHIASESKTNIELIEYIEPKWYQKLFSKIKKIFSNKKDKK